ncbi:hypothetical protein B0H11DRAFT_1712535 [Mycena galericulata]|nr:hypothetical protein B0H11DRAFT_1712535 [Mycena galericulata]
MTEPPNTVDDADPPFFAGQLSNREIWWRDHQVWLEKCGYKLRPRYMPDWVPSWRGTDKSFFDVEDGAYLIPGAVIDAIRIRDNLDVALKLVDTEVHPFELEISTLVSTSPLANDPRNHCVPLLGSLDVPDSNKEKILIMPLLRRYEDPPFDTFGEAIDFFGQLFEGLKFLHDHNIAHRDCGSLNIMMEGSKMFPEGYHPRQLWRKRDFSEHVKFFTRTQRPPRYYFIDFGLSRMYTSRQPPPIEPIIRGGDKSVPEFQNTDADGPISCDPFPIDIYYAGNMIRTDFMDSDDDEHQLSGFEFMRSLVNDMTAKDPAQRPSIDEVIKRFASIRKRLSIWKLRSRLRQTHESPWAIHRPIRHWYLTVGYLLRGLPAIPRASEHK